MLSTLCVFVSMVAAIAQNTVSISGLITDRDTKEAVMMVTVQVLNSDSTFIKGVLISDERFNDDNRHIDEKMEFNQYMEERNVYVIRKDAKEDLIGYRIDDEHYILFDEFDNFSGVVFKNLTDDQIYEMTKAKHPYWENIEIKDEVGENQKGE